MRISRQVQLQLNYYYQLYQVIAVITLNYRLMTLTSLGDGLLHIGVRVTFRLAPFDMTL